ncbi:hypothetical protein [Liquorilactobacillus vini]|uniref:Uncharacterized protein n=1 Tax=Liquorilactobacillus vini DSM 20605 TaxID=1133569 RepID=A0A0R2BY63_9LACO|nr:hypothetical protein [Liquorilactobacillus vini]KRM84200.1 hypothetical protein FD21_GL002097 [Liquorilactobacillus vini DSM 20605]
MTKEQDYIKPPKKTTTAVTDYVQPPKKQATNDDYVKPLKEQISAQDYVKPPKKPISSTEYASTAQEQRPVADQLLSYFQTPKVKLNFYLTGYFFLMCVVYLPAAWSKLSSPAGSRLVAIINFILLIAYILLSNYTYSWYADYQRYKNGAFSWFFTPFGSAKAGYASSAFMNYQTGHVSRGLFGNYKYNSSTNVGKHILIFIIVTLVTEILKFIINIFIAFITIFTHKSTINKYQALVNEQKN